MRYCQCDRDDAEIKEGEALEWTGYVIHADCARARGLDP